MPSVRFVNALGCVCVTRKTDWMHDIWLGVNFVSNKPRLMYYLHSKKNCMENTDKRLTEIVH